MEYQTLNYADKLQLARDAVRAAETDHYRATLDPPAFGGETRLLELEERVVRVREALAELEADDDPS